MTSLARGSVSSVKKAASTADAPIWKAYLAIRSSSTSEVANMMEKGNRSNSRSRKRAKPAASRAGADGAGIWLSLATPLTTTRHNGGDDGAEVLRSVRHYWEQLSVNERQQILFLDEPELVKQLYKLNLSLLCVGLMQRHLKTSNRTAADAVATTKKLTTAGGTAKATQSKGAPSTVPVVQEQTVLPAQKRPATDPSEKTYELLEAMEFMDIGTGILTVKTELAEDTDRLFTLVGDVLSGFLTSIHVLTETNFNKLFVTESETINTWENYQRLIAMLVEQLISRSYVGHLEKEAAQQMEQLLQEVSLEDKSTTTHSTTHSKKKSKKKKKKKSAAHSVAKVEQSKKPEVVGEKSSAEVLSDSGRLKNDEMSVHPENEDMNREPSPEPMPELMQISQDEKCQPDMVPTSFVHPDKTIPTEVEHSTKKPSGLNPNALVFQPQESVSMAESSDTRTPLAGKRKFDEYIISVPFEDVVSDAGSAFDNGSLEDDLSDLEEDTVDESGHERDRRRWRKQRRREEDAALEWQLQQVYASTSSLFGWDFSRQCELPGPGANLPWSESTLWRTAPKEVVRYFSPGNGDAYSRLHAPHFLPVPSGPPPSRYYFNPGPPMPYGPPLLPPPGMEPMPPHLHGSFCFQPPDFPMVVSSPDFSSAQYDPSNHEDQVDV